MFRGLKMNKESKKIRLATVFSGIGAVEQALFKKKINYQIVFACDNGEREISMTYDDIISYCHKNNYSHEQINNYVKSIYSQTKKPNRMKESYFANYKISERSWFDDIRFIDGNEFKDKVDLFYNQTYQLIDCLQILFFF